MPDPAPTTASAMKATLTDARFSDPDWIFERKLDGIRCVAVRDGGATRLLSRNDLALRFPEVAATLDAERRERFAVDGEVVAFAGDQTSFAKLARRGRGSLATRARRAREPVTVFFYVFDLLWLDARDVRGLPLRAQAPLARHA